MTNVAPISNSNLEFIDVWHQQMTYFAMKIPEHLASHHAACVEHCNVCLDIALVRLAPVAAHLATQQVGDLPAEVPVPVPEDPSTTTLDTYSRHVDILEYLVD